MACHRCIYICIEYRFGTLDRPRRCRSIQWYGYGSLGNSRMDDSYLRMGIRTVLFPQYGIHDAGISGTTLQFPVTHHPFSHFFNQLCTYQGSRYGICGRFGVPASIRYQGTLGNRLFLDRCHRSGGTDCIIHHFRRNEVRAIYFRIANSDSAIGLFDHTCTRFQRARRMGRNDEDLRCSHCQ